MKKPRIAFVTNGLGIGGIETSLAETVRLLRRDFSISILYHTRLPRVHTPIPRDIPLYRFAPPYTSRATVRQLTVLLKTIRPDIVHASNFPAYVIAPFAATAAAVAVIITQRDTAEMPLIVRMLREKTILANRLTHTIIAVSRAVADLTSTFETGCAKKIVVLSNGTDTHRIHRLSRTQRTRTRAAFGLGREMSAIGMICRATEEKGILTFLRAAHCLAKRFPQTRFFVVGSGPLLPRFRVHARALDIAGQVIFTGARQDIAAILGMLDIVVCPSIIREGFGLTLLEAMAAEKAVVASRIGGHTELVRNGIDGLLVQPGSVRALVQALERIITNGSLRRRLGAAAFRTARDRFDSRQTVGKLRALYETLLKKSCLPQTGHSSHGNRRNTGRIKDPFVPQSGSTGKIQQGSGNLLKQGRLQ